VHHPGSLVAIGGCVVACILFKSCGGGDGDTPRPAPLMDNMGEIRGALVAEQIHRILGISDYEAIQSLHDLPVDE